MNIKINFLVPIRPNDINTNYAYWSKSGVPNRTHNTRPNIGENEDELNGMHKNENEQRPTQRPIVLAIVSTVGQFTPF